ncbi:MAG: hypothetical protein PUG12_01980 [Prevotella sp.]|nr:hypothetical protein [Prevotella sp.]
MERKQYKKPDTVVLIASPMTLLEDSGNLGGSAKSWTPSHDTWRDDENDYAPWTKQKNVWNE